MTKPTEAFAGKYPVPPLKVPINKNKTFIFTNQSKNRTVINNSEFKTYISIFMKKLSFIALALLLVTGCKNDPKQTISKTTASEKKDSSLAKVSAAEYKTPENKEIPALKECTEKTIEYGSEQECFFPESTIKEVYQKTIKENEIEKAELLLPDLPGHTVEKTINQDGLESIHYKVAPEKIEIEFLFAGGVTTLELEQQGGKVKRTIIHSAD
ncbi:hypothetical protein M9991_10545 [Chryseobacterium gallinarum]|uniref:hypothetical protein n=1 Tax=Chryseobacterium gallinarum TaxID=1324352 RepID=UPI002023E06D|nr:hypothetical protein [Chryseobacterium gallinarum]MCL8537296.1 hypothetical protein [Chryseobacterium gallinarum]